MFNGNRKFAHFSEIWKRKRPSNIVEFCNSCWKLAKNARFHIKSPVKNFHGSAKGGGHRTVALPLNTLLPADNASNQTSSVCFLIVFTCNGERFYYKRITYYDKSSKFLIFHHCSRLAVASPWVTAHVNDMIASGRVNKLALQVGR